MADKLTTGQSLRAAFTSWRVGSVTLLSFPSGLPLGIVLITIPFWMQQNGVDIKTIGLVTAAQIPYAFKFVWSPIVDRYAPRWGRKRFWILLSQAALGLAFLLLAGVAAGPSIAAVAGLTLLISFLSATQDIAIDAYAVELLRREELGFAVGARSALARAGVFVARLVNTLGPKWGWRGLFLGVSVLFAPFLGLTLASPEPEVPITPPRSLLTAIWDPFVGFFRHPRALDIAAFLFLYKYGDNLAISLVSPFFGQMGYAPIDIGLAQGTIGMVAVIVGTIAGGLLSVPLGLGRALWIFGALQALASLGYAFVAHLGGPSVDSLTLGEFTVRPAMYAAVLIENFSQGLGTGAFSVFLLRLTQRQFSATQYALFSSIFALGRTFAGPPAGYLVDAIGWTTFFMLTPLFAIPGLVMLHRFAPISGREVSGLPDDAAAAAPAIGRPLTRAALLVRGLLGAAVGCLAAYGLNVLVSALKASRNHAAFDLLAATRAITQPVRAIDYVDLLGPPLVGVVVGVAVAAYLAARRGVAPSA